MSGQLKIKIVGAQGNSLINAETSIEHLNTSNHATTQIIANQYGVPESPNETLSISDVPEGTRKSSYTSTKAFRYRDLS